MAGDEALGRALGTRHQCGDQRAFILARAAESSHAARSVGLTRSDWTLWTASEGGRARNLDGMNLRLSGFSSSVELKVSRKWGALEEFASTPGVDPLPTCNLRV